MDKEEVGFIQWNIIHYREKEILPIVTTWMK